MNLTPADIEKAIRHSVGDPSVGPISDNAATMAQAVHALLYPKAEKETRVVKATETRAADERID